MGLPWYERAESRGRLLLRRRLVLRRRGSARGRADLGALHAELVERLIVELSARRDVERELELRERRLRLEPEVAVHRAGVEAQAAQLVLHAADELRVRIARGVADGIRLVLFRVERSEGPR